MTTCGSQLNPAETLLAEVFDLKPQTVWMDGVRLDKNEETVVLKLIVAKPTMLRYEGIGWGEPYVWKSRANYKGLWVDVWGSSASADTPPTIWVQNVAGFQGGPLF